VKLYLTSERHALLPALCSSTGSTRRLSPTVSQQWQESAFAASVAPVAVLAAVVPAAALVPSAGVAGATGSVRVDLTVRETEPAEIRTDVTTDEFHVASAALLDQRGTSVQGITGSSAKHDMTAPKPNGGVRGIPPRGRPV